MIQDCKSIIIIPFSGCDHKPLSNCWMMNITLIRMFRQKICITPFRAKNSDWFRRKSTLKIWMRVGIIGISVFLHSTTTSTEVRMSLWTSGKTALQTCQTLQRLQSWLCRLSSIGVSNHPKLHFVAGIRYDYEHDPIRFSRNKVTGSETKLNNQYDLPPRSRNGHLNFRFNTGSITTIKCMQQ